MSSKFSKVILIPTLSTILVACGGGGSGSGDSNNTPPNQAPSANAGSDISVNEGNPARLDASGSSDPDGDSLSVSWRQTSGSSVTLSDSSSLRPEFTAPNLLTNEDLIFELTVNDGTSGVATDTVTVTILADNDAPLANAGSDSSVEEGRSIELDGSQSSDPESEALTFQWRQTSGTSVVLNAGDTATPSFTAPELLSNEVMSFELNVSDGSNTETDSVSITINADNDQPTANAGPNQRVIETTQVTLDASTSSDPENETLSYEWTQTQGSTVSLSSTTAVNPSFFAPDVASDQTLTFALTVRDSANTSTNTSLVDIVVPAVTDFMITSRDSQRDPAGTGVPARIRSQDNGSPTYRSLPSVRQDSSGTDISIDFMVHEPSSTAKGLIVLIAGGTLNASIQGSTTTGEVTSAGNNFLVRSAHLFAEQGYRVITMDRPSDFASFTGAFNSDFDPYRLSMVHSVDIASIVADVNQGDNLPVIIAGTSRGAISAVAQDKLAAALALSAPVTSGNGSPVSASNYDFPNLTDHIHVSWHIDDGCFVSTPAGSENLTSDLLSANLSVEGRAINGGFDNPFEPNPCAARRLHGFFGIESSAVGTVTDWLDRLIDNSQLPATRPIANAATFPASSPLNIDLSSLTSGTGALSYDTTFNSSSLGGSISISGNTLTYNAPAAVTGTMDSFVYIVTDENGGTSHNVIKVNL